jgi:hypothetical protein
MLSTYGLCIPGHYAHFALERGEDHVFILPFEASLSLLLLFDRQEVGAQFWVKAPSYKLAHYTNCLESSSKESINPGCRRHVNPDSL